MDNFVVETIERATVHAVAPDEVKELPGWLLPFDDGTIGRAHSAVPLVHLSSTDQVTQQVGQLEEIAAMYRSRGLRPVFRLPETSTLLHGALSRMGFERSEPSLVMAGTLEDFRFAALPPRSLSQHLVVVSSEYASADWQSMFLGASAGSTDAAHRIRNLSRAAGTVFVSATVLGETLACGAAAFSHGWLGIHGMRTSFSHQGLGMATNLLSTMLDIAFIRGIDRVFLQVGADNQRAIALYRRSGFSVLWSYAYWKLGG